MVRKKIGMKKKTIKGRYQCYKCGKRFISWQQRDKHSAVAHMPPQPPVTRTEVTKGRMHSATLREGGKLRLGDTIYFEQRAVIKKITYTEGSQNVQVECEIITDTWRQG